MLTLIHGGPAAQLWAGDAVIKAADREPIASATALLARADAIHADAERRVADASASGFADGRDRGIAALADAQAAALAALTRDVAARMAARDDAIAQAALAAVRALLGDAGMASAGITAGLVARAVAALPDHVSAITVRVAPGAVDATTAALAGGPSHDGLPIRAPAIRVEGDEALGPLDALIDAGRGQLVASLSVQLDELAQRWGVTADDADRAHAADADDPTVQP